MANNTRPITTVFTFRYPLQSRLVSLALFVFCSFLPFLPKAQSLLAISEYMPVNNGTIIAPNGLSLPWLEIQNMGDTAVPLHQFSIRFVENNVVWVFQLPDKILRSNSAKVFWIIDQPDEGYQGLDDFFYIPEFAASERLQLLTNETGQVLDEFRLSSPAQAGEVFLKTSLLQNETLILNPEMASPELPNLLQTNWKKISGKGVFPAADSEPNACLTYRDKIWIFGGWQYDNTEHKFESKTYVWNSSDGIAWEEILPIAPFSHYSSFIVFNDTMWVYTGFEILSSTDGITWANHGLTPYDFFGYYAKLTVKGDTLFFIEPEKSGYSIDGINFIIEPHNIPYRLYGTLATLNGALYYFGGQDEQGAGTYFNDVWKSYDGVNWEITVDSTPWQGRKWFMSNVFDNKIWIMGGYNHTNKDNLQYSNLNDIWFSENGEDWKPYKPIYHWPIRHAAYHTLKDDKLWVMGGFDNYERNGFFNDTWHFEATSYFHKKGEPINDPSSWYSAPDGFGIQLPDFDGHHKIFYLSSDSVKASISNLFNGVGNILVVGNGVDSAQLTITGSDNLTIPVYVSPKATLTIEKNHPNFNFFPHQLSTIAFRDLQDYAIPPLNYHSLSIQNCDLLNSGTLVVGGDLVLNSISLPNQENGISIIVDGNITLGNTNALAKLSIFGAHEGNQTIKTPDLSPVKISSISLKKPKGEFVFQGSFEILTRMDVSYN